MDCAMLSTRFSRAKQVLVLLLVAAVACATWQVGAQVSLSFVADADAPGRAYLPGAVAEEPADDSEPDFGLLALASLSLICSLLFSRRRSGLFSQPDSVFHFPHPPQHALIP
jgi:hypothetical protein